jgi:hypothetical protein
LKGLLRSSKFWWIRILAVVVSFLFFAVAAWIAIYPPDGDPKGINYVLWKSGVYNMNVDNAVGLMVGDPKRDKLVIGQTKEQLRHRFGYLLKVADASPYLRGCYLDSSRKGRDVLFIRSSPWMVVFDGDTAIELVLVKGC